MSVEVIRDIKNAEQVAEEKIKSAQQMAKDLVMRAEEDAEKLIKEAVNNQLLKGRRMVEAAEQEALAESAVKKQENQARCDELKRSSSSKLSEAVKFVMERIVKINGHS